MLTAAAFAVDAATNAKAILDASRDGNDEEAEQKRKALSSSLSREGLARRLALSEPHPPLRRIVGDLDIGLGVELDEWLDAQMLRIPLISAWYVQYGPDIGRFVAYADARTKPQMRAISLRKPSLAPPPRQL